MESIVFWQRMLTPHMTELAIQLAYAGLKVHYVTEDILSDERRAMGWSVGDMTMVSVHFAASASDVHRLLDQLPSSAVHITQGVRSNGLIEYAQARIILNRLRHYPIMEKVDLRGVGGWVKPVLYMLRFWSLSRSVEGILAIGEGNKEWISRLSPKALKVIPFAYFLQAKQSRPSVKNHAVFRFIFVGALIERKRVDLMLNAFSALVDHTFEIEIVGDGPQRERLERFACERLPGKVRFTGTLDMKTAIDHIESADCLVLPSDHDGWGAVVSEAQINGTPVVCSSSCGAAGTVKSSGFGAVFEAGDLEGLRGKLLYMLDRGQLDESDRKKLIHWARNLTAEIGANYLLQILRGSFETTLAVNPPWQQTKL